VRPAAKPSLSRISLIATVSRTTLGTSKPTVALPGIGARMRIEIASRAIARSFSRLSMLRQLDAGIGLELVAGDHRARVDLRDLARDLELVDSACSMRSACSSTKFLSTSVDGLVRELEQLGRRQQELAGASGARSRGSA
jgi:hypothetical protein